MAPTESSLRSAIAAVLWTIEGTTLTIALMGAETSVSDADVDGTDEASEEGSPTATIDESSMSSNVLSAREPTGSLADECSKPTVEVIR